MHRSEEGRREVRRTVVGHLQHIGPQVDAGGQQVLLRLDLGVAGQQDGGSTHACPQHE